VLGARHILFAEDTLHRPGDFAVKASAVNTEEACLIKAGFLFEKQQGDHQIVEAPAIQSAGDVMPNKILRGPEENSGRSGKCLCI